MSRNLEGVKIAVLVGGGLLALFFAGQIFQLAARWTARALSGAVLILTALAAAYVAYQVYTGWDAAAENEQTPPNEYTDNMPSTADNPDSVDDLEAEYVDGDLSEAEFERELESILEETDDTEQLTETER